MKIKKLSAIILVFVITATVLCFPVSASTGNSFWSGFHSFFSGLLDGIGVFISNAVSHILDGIGRFFIPKQNAFDNFQKDISVRFNAKFGAVTSAFDYLGGRFKGLREYKDLPGVFKVTFPKNSFLSGLSVNFLSVAAPVISFIRLFMTGICCLFTALTCYHKVIKMINT